MGFSEFLTAGIPALITILVPGFLLALPLLKKTKLGFPETLGIGFTLGLVIPPFLLMFESFFGLLYSYELFIANAVLLSIIGLVLCYKEKVFPIDLKFNLKRDWYWILLLLFMITAFYLRIQTAFPTTAGAYFYEFDPYFYTRSTQFIIEEGQIPRFDDLAWYPYPTSHRAPPLANYLGAQWYSLYNGGRPFDIYALGFAQSFYPPVVATAAVFFIFLLLAEPYGKRMGLIAAGLFAFAPRVIEKLAAWEQEQTPWGVFGAVFFYAAYMLVLSRRDKRLAVLAGIALAALTLGSKSDVQAYLLLAAYLAVQGIIDYLKGRLNWEFIELNGIIIGFGLFAQLIMSQLYASTPYLPTDPFAVLGAFYFYYALWAISDKLRHKREWGDHEKVLLLPIYIVEQSKLIDLEADKGNYLAVLLALAAAALLLTPLGPPVIGYVQAAAGQALPGDPLANTVAEEAGAGNQFVSAMGPLGIPLMWLFDAGLLEGTNAQMVLLIPFLLALAFAWYKDSKYSLYFAFLVLPVMWVGLGKAKFVLQLTTATIIGFVALLGGLVLFIQSIASTDEQKKMYANVAFAVGALLVLLTAWPALFVVQLSTASEVYTEAPTGEKILDCNAIGPYFESNMIRLPGADNDRALNLAYYLYCSRIPQWWLDPMNWIRENVPEDERVIHWWDYGHWTNYFGQRKTVTRNDHPYIFQDLEMADLLVSNTPEHAAQWMKEHEAKYLLLDQDLINKWGALVYLSCVHNNETEFIPRQVGSSACEHAHYFERVFIPANPQPSEYCNIDTGSQFVIAHSTHRDSVYCVGEISADGQTALVMVNEEDGSQNRGLLMHQGQTILNDGRLYETYMVLYPPEGQGYEDRVGKGYDSVFYKGFFLGHIDGFDQVYPYHAEHAMVGPS
ncbi:hypothetical protein DRN67_01690, partial [Candidatus Micrarchaeota archaeon]